MPEWVPVKSIKGGKGTEFASIDKSGRLLMPTKATSVKGLKPGCFLECYTKKDCGALLIGLKPVPQETAYALRVSCTSRLEDFGKDTDAGRKSRLCTTLRAALSAHGYELIRRIRVPFAWDEGEGMFVVTIGMPVTTEADIIEVE